MKKLFISITMITIMLFLSLGCVTQQVWKKGGPTYSNIPYNETIISFYVNNNTSEIAFMGTKYHYILKDYNQRFTEIMEAKKLLNLSQKNLQITTSTVKDRPRVSSRIKVKFDLNSLNEKQLLWLKAHGFSPLVLPPKVRYKEPKEGMLVVDLEPKLKELKVIAYTKEFSLDGKRYYANKDVNHRLDKLNKPLNLQIDESVKDDAPSKVVEGLKVPLKIVATPFALVADALLALGFVFMPFKI